MGVGVMGSPSMEALNGVVEDKGGVVQGHKGVPI